MNTTAVVERMPNPVAEARMQLQQMESQFKAALPAHIPVERFARVVMTAIQNKPALVTKCTRQSLWNSCMKAAQDGLLPDGREGAIVEYGDQAQWMPMIAGLRKKVRNSGEIATWDVNVVHKNDKFAFRLGDDPFIAHEPTLDDPGPVVAAYAIAVLKSGEKSREVMSVTAIEKVRGRSKAKNNGPWITDYEEMCRKTVARRHSKVLPMSTDLDDLIRRDDALYDMEGAKDEAQTGRPKSLAGRLDALAALNGNGVVVDRETGEITEPAQADAAQADAAPAEQLQPDPEQAGGQIDIAEEQFAQSAEPAIPANEPSYKAYVAHKLALFTDADAISPWFVSDQERELRGKCGVTKPVFDALLANIKARATQLKKPKA